MHYPDESRTMTNLVRCVFWRMLLAVLSNSVALSLKCGLLIVIWPGKVAIAAHTSAFAHSDLPDSCVYPARYDSGSDSVCIVRHFEAQRPPPVDRLESLPAIGKLSSLVAFQLETVTRQLCSLEFQLRGCVHFVSGTCKSHFVTFETQLSFLSYIKMFIGV